MDVHTEQLIDIALNVAGYLLAGGLWLLVYTAWQNRRATRAAGTAKSETVGRTAVAAAAVVPANLAPTPALPKEGRRSLEFVTFRGDRRQSEPAAAPTAEATLDRRRNRAEVFALARRMLAEGASADAVKSELPVSDGELALLHGKH